MCLAALILLLLIQRICFLVYCKRMTGLGCHGQQWFSKSHPVSRVCIYHPKTRGFCLKCNIVQQTVPQLDLKCPD